MLGDQRRGGVLQADCARPPHPGDQSQTSIYTTATNGNPVLSPRRPGPHHPRYGHPQGEVLRQDRVQHPQARAGHCVQVRQGYIYHQLLDVSTVQPDHLLDGSLLRPSPQHDHLHQDAAPLLHQTLLPQELVSANQNILRGK